MDSLFQGLKSTASGHKDQDQDSHQKPDHNPSPHQTDHKPSTTELLASAKLVADAAKSTTGSESDKVDKSKVAAASADLLDAGQRYGKLDENTGAGKYVEKAEDYLENYSHGHGGSGQTGHVKPKPEQHEGGHDAREERV